MADISSILGGEFTPPGEEHLDPPEIQLMIAMEQAGLEAPDHIVMDGQIHRFRSGTKGKAGAGRDKTGWYVCFGDGVPAGRFGCWRSDVEHTWRANVGRKFTAVEEMALTRRMAEAKAARDEERKKTRQTAADTVSTIWENCTAASPDHPYIKRKGIKVNGARVTGDGRLVVPLYSHDGGLSSLQYIDHNGGKLYHPGGMTGGCYNIIGTMDVPGVVYIAEGHATAATIYETTGRPCVVSYSASNLVPVTGFLREKMGQNQDLFIVADNDKSHVGQKYAEQASAKYGARYIIPPEEGDANDYAMAGNDLADLLAPKADDWLVRADEFASQPAPIKWLVKNWIQDEALIMIHGPSGGGKTFCVLDILLSASSGMKDWHGNIVRCDGPIVYLAGEGHHGLRSRIAGWMDHNNAKEINMFVSKDGCDLNTPEGYQRVTNSLDALPTPPKAITVDTLHRFLYGDENSSQDAKTMLDACAGLIARYKCAVILVHHTGVSDEAQHRARGSSAWRGALDIEISVIPAKDDKPMMITQRKSKDAELAQTMYFDLVSTDVFDWKDEDGEQVTTAIIQPAEAPQNDPEVKRDSKAAQHKKTLTRAWFDGGAEEREGNPYISRSTLKAMLMKDGSTERAVNGATNPDKAGGLVNGLINAEIITPHEHGWIVCHDVEASAMMLMKL